MHYVYVCARVRIGMARKVNKTLSLPLDVVERLEEEDHQSGTVAEALQHYWETNEQ